MESKQSSAAPKYAEVPVTREGEETKNHFDKVPARRKRQLDAEGLQPISGAGQASKLAEKLSASSGKQLQSKFRKADGRVGSISEYPGFAKAAKESGND